MGKYKTLSREGAEMERGLLRRANFKARVYQFFGLNGLASSLYSSVAEQIAEIRENMFGRASTENRQYYVTADPINARLASKLLDISTGALVASL